MGIMAAHSDSLAQALEYHKAGRLEEAELCYRGILQADPRNSDALHLLGVLAHQCGRHEQAIAYIEQALTLVPDEAAFHSDLGLAYQVLGQHAEARACWQR